MTEAPLSIPLEIQESAKRMLEKHRATMVKRRHGKSKWQNKLDEIDDKMTQLRREHVLDNPHLKEIEQKIVGKATVASDMICPSCGDGDKGNKINGKPWCFKCNTTLIHRNKIGKWTNIKIVSNSLKSESKKINPGLDPKEER
ncbi:hypothetical protein MUP77_17695 [Candidatus Bathyarchaeota archaeon]|nr:hypothetical protein [Candidatus Bathyarchaeota archaeon]